jgi:hypothetical protein
VLYRLQARAAHTGAAREDVVSRRGPPGCRCIVWAMTASCGGLRSLLTAAPSVVGPKR